MALLVAACPGTRQSSARTDLSDRRPQTGSAESADVFEATVLAAITSRPRDRLGAGSVRLIDGGGGRRSSAGQKEVSGQSGRALYRDQGRAKQARVIAVWQSALKALWVIISKKLHSRLGPVSKHPAWGTLTRHLRHRRRRQRPAKCPPSPTAMYSDGFIYG